MSLTVYVILQDKTKYNITHLVTGLDWSGDINTWPRQIDVTLQNVNSYVKDTLVNYNVGNLVLVYSDGAEIFRGYIFTKNIDQTGNATFTAYDHLVYATKNNDTILVKNQTADNILRQQCNKYSIPIGYLENTVYKVKKQAYDNQSITDIVTDMLSRTKTSTGKRYIVYSVAGKVYLYSRENCEKHTISVNHILTGSKTVSIEDSRTKVKVVRGSIDSTDKSNHYATYTASDSDYINKYGTIQEVISVDSSTKDAEMKSKAETTIKTSKLAKVTTEVTLMGNVVCTTGKIITLKDDITNITGTFYITSDKHSWSNGEYTMDLQLSSDIS